MNDYNGRNGNGYQPLPTPPTTEYVGKPDLPLLLSERRELEQKVRDANQRYELAFDAALRRFTAVINLRDDLTEQQKKSILSETWK